jgi:hypothetical protein
MTFLLFELDQLFTLLVPAFIFAIFANIPSEANFVEKSLSIRSNFVVDVIMTLSLRANPNP